MILQFVKPCVCCSHLRVENCYGRPDPKKGDCVTFGYTIFFCEFVVHSLLLRVWSVAIIFSLQITFLVLFIGEFAGCMMRGLLEICSKLSAHPEDINPSYFARKKTERGIKQMSKSK
jgi:hypothetical protein